MEPSTELAEPGLKSTGLHRSLRKSRMKLISSISMINLKSIQCNDVISLISLANYFFSLNFRSNDQIAKYKIGMKLVKNDAAGIMFYLKIKILQDS